MPVVVTPVSTLTLMVGTEQVECQVTSHNLQDADPTAGDTIRTACGDVVAVEANATEVGTLDLTLFPERGVTGFEAWTWLHAREVVDFKLTVNPTDPASALEWTGKLTVAAIPEKQDEYPVKETTDVSWSVTEWTTRAVAPAA